ncbi:MAG: Ig-like domain-containing protein [Pseudomonadota bacterium]
MPQEISGELKTWHKVTIDFESPQNFSEQPETFRDYRLDVTFTNADTGQTITVPGYFAADGDAANSGATSGNTWRVNFNPPEAGEWTYEASFRTGTDIAAKTYAEAPNAGTAVGFIDGEGGTLNIAETDKTGEDFRAKGMIVQDQGTHYLQHQGDGDYFIRGGPGIPENFLANPDIDGTSDGRHDYATHVNSFNAGDPTWDGGQGKAIIGAVNYLAEQGQNTFYLLTNTAGGDGQDVWPWVGDFGDVGKHDKGIANNEKDDFSTYDVSKLGQWEIIFDHMDDKGIYKNVLLQETENDQLLNGGTSVDGSSLSVERLVYMREMVARFGHSNGLQWNMGEENTNTDQEREDMAEYLKSVDAYDHLVVVHTFGGEKDIYDDLLGEVAFDGPSFQTSAQKIRDEVEKYRDASDAAGDPWVLAWDEDSSGNGIVDLYSNNPDSTNEKTLREAFWGTLTAGGSGGNWYLKGSSGHSLDQNYDTFEAHSSIWKWTAAATEFFNTYIPFWDMEQDDGATADNDDFVMSKDGEYYVIYLPYGEAGDVKLDLGDQGGESFDVFWYNPRTGGALIDAGQVDGGAVRQIGGAPSEGGKDWVLLVRNSDLPDRPPSVPVDPNQPDPDPTPAPGGIAVTLYLIDANTNQRVGEIEEGSTIQLAGGDLGDFAIEAVPDGNVGSVRFDFQGATKVENVAPFALFGDTDGNFTGQAPTIGSTSVSVELFSGADGTGTSLGKSEVDFTIQVGGGAPADPDPVDPAPVDPTPTDPDPDDGVPVHVMENGLVVMQAETGVFEFEGASANTNWELTNQFAGTKGDGALLWTGNDYFATSNGGTQKTAPMEYQFTVDEPGTYYISIRAARPVTGEPGDRNNDFFVNFEGGDWKKVFFSGPREKYQWGTTYDVNHKKSPALVEITQQMIDANDGVFSLGVSGRSRFAAFDEIHINKDTANLDHDAKTSEILTTGPVTPPEPVNSAPVATADTAATVQDDAVLIDVLANDSDSDGDALSIVQVGSASGGTIEIVDGKLRYVADGDFEGEDTFTYTISDGNGGTDSSEVTVDVSAKQEPEPEPEPQPEPEPEPQPEPEPEPEDVAMRFYLADTDTDETLMELTADAKVGYDMVEGRDVTVYAVTADGTEVGSMRLSLSGNGSRVENVTPYSLSGDTDGDFFEGTGMEPGSYTLDVSAFDGSDAKGALIGGTSISFEVVEAPASQIRAFLADADTNETLMEVTNGGTIDRTALGDRDLTIYATAEAEAAVESMMISGAGGGIQRTENVEPYAIFGDTDGDFFSGGGLPGQKYSLTFDAFSADKGKGKLIDTLEVDLNFVDGAGSEDVFAI